MEPFEDGRLSDDTYHCQHPPCRMHICELDPSIAAVKMSKGNVYLRYLVFFFFILFPDVPPPVDESIFSNLDVILKEGIISLSHIVECQINVPVTHHSDSFDFCQGFFCRTEDEFDDWCMRIRRVRFRSLYVIGNCNAAPWNMNHIFFNVFFLSAVLQQRQPGHV